MDVFSRESKSVLSARMCVCACVRVCVCACVSVCVSMPVSAGESEGEPGHPFSSTGSHSCFHEVQVFYGSSSSREKIL